MSGPRAPVRLCGADLAAWVTASCAAQGVPVKITDPVTITKICVRLNTTLVPATGRRGRSVSEGPDRVHAGRVEPRDPGAGTDDRVIEDAADHRGLTGQPEARPLAS